MAAVIVASPGGTLFVDYWRLEPGHDGPGNGTRLVERWRWDEGNNAWERGAPAGYVDLPTTTQFNLFPDDPLHELVVRAAQLRASGFRVADVDTSA